MRPATIACAAILIALAACSEPQSRVDASTPESTVASLEEIQSGLPEDRREQFSEALAILIPEAMGGNLQTVGNTPEVRARVQEALRGKTADEIIAEAERIRRERAATAGSR